MRSKRKKREAKQENSDRQKRGLSNCMNSGRVSKKNGGVRTSLNFKFLQRQRNREKMLCVGKRNKRDRIKRKVTTIISLVGGREGRVKDSLSLSVVGGGGKKKGNHQRIRQGTLELVLLRTRRQGIGKQRSGSQADGTGRSKTPRKDYQRPLRRGESACGKVKNEKTGRGLSFPSQ